jgi:multiple sugar transport system substrate-binding protein
MHRFALLSLVFAILLGACTPTIYYLPLSTATVEATLTAPTKTPRPTPTLQPTQSPNLGVDTQALRGLTVNLWHGLDGASAQTLAQMAAEFNLSNPWGITVSVSGAGNLAGLLEKVNNAEATAGAVDLVLAQPEHLGSWGAAEKIVDLNPYIQHPEFGLKPDEIEDIPPALWAQDEAGSARFGVPLTRTGRFLFYNVTLARELGFNKPPQSLDEFREQACAANAAWKADSDETNDGYGGWAFDGDPWTAYSWLVAAGGAPFVDGQFKFDTPQNASALDFLLEMRADGCIWIPSSLTNSDFLANRSALFITGALEDIAAQKSAFTTALSTDEWTILPFPGEHPLVVAYGPSFGVFDNGPARQLASWLFTRWMLLPENQARWARETGLLPVRASALDLLKDYQAANPHWVAAANLVWFAQPYPQAPTWRLARTIFGDGFDTLFRLYPYYEVGNVLKQMDATLLELTK